MDQKFCKVMRDGKEWFQFPSVNENEVRIMLMKQGIDGVCDILPVNSEVKVIKETVIDMSKTKPSKSEKQI
jgi:hypothetical protein